MEVREALLTRRSVRAFDTDKKIPREALERMVEAARYAPSGMNRQLWHFAVVQSPALIGKLAAAVRQALGRDEGYDFYAPNALILVSNDPDNPHGVEDNACALQNIFLMAHADGIGSVWINQFKGICDRPEVRALLDEAGVPKGHRVTGAAALGYPAKPAEPKEKKEDVVSWVL